MEEFSGEMERAGLQKQTLFKAYEQAQSQASSLLLFSLRWKELEERFDGIQRSLAERARDVASREDALRSAARRVEEREEEVRRKEAELRSVESRLEGWRDERREVERELALKRDALMECDSLIRSKEEELQSLVRATEECRTGYGSKKEKVEALQQEVELKEKKVGSVQAILEEVFECLELKSRELDAVRASIEDRNLELASKEQEFESKKKQCDLMQKSITECSQELELKSRELDAVRASIEDRNLELASKEQEFESKKKQRDLMQKSVTECSQELESRTSQLNSIQWRIGECSTDLQLREQYLYMLDVSIREHSRIFEMQKEEWGARCMGLELERQRLDSIEKSLEKRPREMELRERTPGHSGVMAQNVNNPYGPVAASCLNSQSTNAFDGKKMQMFVYQHFQELNGVCYKVLEIIRTSAKAAKLVLDAMEGFYPQDSGNRDGSVDIGVIRRSCIFLLENLIRSSSEIKPQQREAAMKLAVEWKGKLKSSPSPEHPLEVLGFLKRLEAYKLASAFNAKEIDELVKSVSQFQIAQDCNRSLALQ